MQNVDNFRQCGSDLIHYFQNQINVFFVNAPFFHSMMLLLPKIVSCGVLKQEGEFTFRKVKIIHMWHIVSSIARKLNWMDFVNSCCN